MNTVLCIVMLVAAPGPTGVPSPPLITGANGPAQPR